ncbi:hypothetical protein SSCG_05755 [Streptomyces clavuligerus]|nr:hypothetical protein SSCG_05755 [Streptomyces clavuligerus]
MAETGSVSSVHPANSDADDWHRAVKVLTGFVMPERKLLFNNLLGNDKIPLMRVEISDHNGEPSDAVVDAVDDLSWLEKNSGWRIEETDFVIPFYSGLDGAIAGAPPGTTVRMKRARITLLGTTSSGDKVLQPAHGVALGSEFKSGLGKDFEGQSKDVVWSNQALAQYSYGGGLALERLVTSGSTQFFAWNDLKVDDANAVDLESFEYNAQAFDRVAQFFARRSQELKDWEFDLGKQEAVWKGQAAGVFKDLIHGLARIYRSYSEQFPVEGNVRSVYGNDLRRFRADVRTAADGLFRTWRDDWRDDHGNPLVWLIEVLKEVTKDVWKYNLTKVRWEPIVMGDVVSGSHEVKFERFSGAVSYGKLEEKDTWKKIGEEAIGRWQQKVQEILSPAGKKALMAVENAFMDQRFPKKIDTVSVNLDNQLAKDIADKARDDANKAKDDANKAKIENDNKVKALEEEFRRKQEEAEAEARRRQAEADAKQAEAERKQEQKEKEAEAKQAEAERKRDEKEREAEAKQAEAERKQEEKQAEAERKRDEKEREAGTKQAEAERKQEEKQAEQEARQERLQAEQEAKQDRLQAEAERKQAEQEAKQEQKEREAEERQTLLMNQARIDQERQRREQERKQAEQEAKQGEKEREADAKQAEAERKQEEKEAEQERKQAEKEKEAEAKQAEAERERDEKQAEQEAKQEQKEKEAEQKRIRTEAEYEAKQAEAERKQEEKQAEQEARQERLQAEQEARQDRLQAEADQRQAEAEARREQQQAEQERKQAEAEKRAERQMRELGMDSGSGSRGTDGPRLPGGDSGTTTLNPDGSVTMDYPDGSSRTFDLPGGEVVTTRPDGSTVTGTLRPGESITNPDGSVTRLGEDGRLTTSLPDGSRSVLDPDRSTLTNNLPDGTRITTPVDPGETVPTGVGGGTPGGANGSGGGSVYAPDHAGPGYEEELYDQILDRRGGGADYGMGTGNGAGGMPMLPMGRMSGAGAGGAEGERMRGAMDDGQPVTRRSPGGRGQEDVVMTQRGGSLATSSGGMPFMPPMGGAGDRQTESADRDRSSWMEKTRPCGARRGRRPRCHRR